MLNKHDPSLLMDHNDPFLLQNVVLKKLCQKTLGCRSMKQDANTKYKNLLNLLLRGKNNTKCSRVFLNKFRQMILSLYTGVLSSTTL